MDPCKKCINAPSQLHKIFFYKSAGSSRERLRMMNEI